MKRKILAIAVILVFAALLAWGTVAYFTAEDQAVNVLTIGSVDTEIEEYDQTGHKIDSDYEPESFKNIEPGQRIIKQVVIDNRGENKAWIRAKILETITSSDGQTLNESVLTYNVNDLNDSRPQTAEGDWVQRGDYYYFDTPVEPGEKVVLFDVVTFDGPGMGNAYQGCTTKIQVIAQAVQYEGNTDCDSASWPAEPERIPGSEFYETGGEEP